MDSIVHGNLRLEVQANHGDRVERVTLKTPAPQVAVRQPEPPEPPTSDELLGREDLIQESTRLLHTGRVQAVEFHASCGFGKSSLLRVLGARLGAEAGLPTVWLQVGGERAEDLLQHLFDALYTADRPFKPLPEQRASLLARVQAVIVLDDVEVDPDQLDAALGTVAGCTVVLAASQPTVGRRGRSLGLAGLDDEAAMQLLGRQVGRALTDPERADAERLCRAVDGQPLHLRQAAALIREAGFSLAELADKAGDDPHALDRLSVSILAEQERRLLAVLALAAGSLLPKELIEAMSDLSDLGDRLVSLRRRGLVEQHQDRFGLPVCQAESYRRMLLGHLKVAAAARELGNWLRRGPSTGPAAVSAAKAAVTVVGVLAGRGEWPAVVRLAEVAEPILTLAGRWDACRQVLQRGLQAAQTVEDTAAEALFSHQLGTLALCRDELDDARELLQHALQLRNQLGDDAGVAVTAHNLQLLAPMPPTEPAGSRPAATRPRGRLAGLLGRRRLGVTLARAGLLALLTVVLLVRLLGASPAPPPAKPEGLVAPTVINFPSARVGKASQARSIPIKSRDATTLTVAGVTLTSEEPGEFALQDHCTGSTVTQTVACSLTATFRPTKVGDRSAQVVIHATAPGVTTLVRLHGVGTPSTPGRATTPTTRPTTTAARTVTTPPPRTTDTSPSTQPTTVTAPPPIPQVGLDVSSGPPGTVVTATGDGFHPHQPVQVSQSGGPGITGGGATVQADGAGRIQVTFRVADSTPPGPITIHFRQAPDTEVTETFVVTAPAR